MRRIDISAKYRGITIKFKELIARMKEDAEVQRRLLSDKDRELFEDILANTISKKIRGKIQASKRWVEKMNTLMESMKTSSGLTLSLRWKNKTGGERRTAGYEGTCRTSAKRCRNYASGRGAAVIRTFSI